MAPIAKPFHLLLAGDLMSHELIMIPQEMSLRAAARLLSQHHISGAPVVDANGLCIGVLSNTDFVHRAEAGEPIERAQSCHSSWQVVDVETVSTDRVATAMTKDVVTVQPKATIAQLARVMLDAHIHRVIVVDGDNKPIGIISTTDILAAVGKVEDHRRESPSPVPPPYLRPACS